MNLDNCTLHKFFKRKQIEMLMFGHVESTRLNMPTVSIQKAVLQFFDYYNIDEGEYDPKSMEITYQRMKTEIIEVEKSK